jgi:hypothetical protein
MASSKDLSGFVPIAPVNVADFEATDYEKVGGNDRAGPCILLVRHE